MSRPLTIADFWARMLCPGEDECWEWQGELRRGYGAFQVLWSKTRCAHRIAWELTNGPIPNGLFVLHKCDNPPCCNPKHLFLGTQLDNRKDMLSKGRQDPRHGSNNGFSVLVEADVLSIREKYVPGIVTLAHLAKLYNVNYKTVHDIVRGVTWKHVGGPIAVGELRGKFPRK